MALANDFAQSLKLQADIVRIVQDYVSLKKKGANWMACCPFHKEKTASFSVSPSKDIFYCFGCQKGGSVFNFVMEMERVTFPDAIKIVADKAGVPLPKLVDDSRFESHKRDSDQVIELNQWALQWWEDQLKNNYGKAARKYLAGRGITEETIKTFRLGFAPDSWEMLSSHLLQKGATQEQLEKSGLVVRKDEGGSYDRFRGRLMFPVIDAQGRPMLGRGASGYDASLKPIKQDVAKSKKLLADAGFPNGVEITLNGPQGRYVRDKEVAEAAAGQLTKAGIKTTLKTFEFVNYLNNMVYVHKAGPVWLIGWGQGMMDAEGIYVPLFHTGSLLSNYHNPDFDGMVDQAQTMMDEKQRLAQYYRINKLWHDDQPAAPLYQQIDLYGASKRLNWKARSDEAIKAYDMSLK
jgi:hypothetical protein